jgi:DNA-directed RNA polymerase subunit RPC12/RpoP
MSANLQKIGNTDPVCPYCGKQLEKMPARKSQCPHCSNYYFVRTRPADRLKVIVTEAQASQIEEEWALIDGSHEQLIADRQVYADERSRLAQKFNREPSDHDVRWSLLNKELLEHAQIGNWGLYRNTKFAMAEILRQEMRLEASLTTYLEICYIDINGPNNIGGFIDLKLPPFAPNQSIIAPGIISRALRIIRKLNFDEQRTKEEFIEIATINHTSLKLPVTPANAWDKLKTELFKN